MTLEYLTLKPWNWQLYMTYILIFKQNEKPKLKNIQRNILKLIFISKQAALFFPAIGQSHTAYRLIFESHIKNISVESKYFCFKTTGNSPYNISKMA